MTNRKNKDIRHDYPKETAGRIMTISVPIVGLNDTISRIESRLLSNVKNYEVIDYIYVVDSNKKLKGVISIKELFRAPKSTQIKNIINRNLIYTKPHTDQERVALLSIKHGIKAMPVVDKRGKFLGAVYSREILKVLHTESIQDALLYAGLSSQDNSDITKISISKSIKSRLPWLTIGLFGGIISAQIIGLFNNSLSSNLVLAMFMPIVIYMADAVASQVQILFIRNITSNTSFSLKRYLLREINISMFTALITSLLFASVSFIWQKDLILSITLGIALLIAIFFAIGVAIIIPFTINKLKKDPAMGSGPFGTIITDILSLITYFSVTTLILEML